MRRWLLTPPTGASGGGAVTLPASIAVDASMESPSTAEADITFNADGEYESTNVIDVFGDWFTPAAPGVGSAYEIRFTVNSGSVSTGTTGAWLSFPQTWTRTRLVAGASVVEGTLEIRLTATGVVQDSCTFQLSAEVV